MIARTLTETERSRAHTLREWAIALVIGRKLLSDDPRAEVIRGISRWTCANPCSCPQHRSDLHTHEFDYSNHKAHT